MPLVSSKFAFRRIWERGFAIIVFSNNGFSGISKDMCRQELGFTETSFVKTGEGFLLGYMRDRENLPSTGVGLTL